MKILLINRYHHRVGGSETVYFNTADLLCEKGHDVSFFAMDYPQNVDSRESRYFTQAFDFNSLGYLNKIRGFRSFFYNRKAARSLENLIRDIRPDVAHIHLFYGSLTSSILVTLRKYKIPIVITEHDYRLVCPAYVFLDGKNKLCERCRGRRFYNCVKNRCAKRSFFISLLFTLEAYYRNIFYPPEYLIDKIIFVSQFSSKIHLKHRPEFARQAVQLYNFIPSVKKNFVTRRGDYFLYIGRLSFEKGVLKLVEAFNKRPNYKLKIAGSGPLLDDVLTMKENNIEYCGFLEGTALENLILESSFVIVPSEWYETLCMSAVEALSLGKPVIAANIGGLPEVVDDRRNGFLFEAFSVEDLLKKIDLADATTDSEYGFFSENAKAVKMGKFNSERHYKELIHVYESAISEARN